MEDFTQIPLAVAALLYIIKLLIDYIKDSRKSKNEPSGVLDAQFKRDFYNMKKQTEDLHDWHNKEDGDGRKIWYVKESLEESIKSLSESINENTKTLGENMKENTTVLQGLHSLINRIEEG